MLVPDFQGLEPRGHDACVSGSQIGSNQFCGKSLHISYATSKHTGRVVHWRGVLRRHPKKLLSRGLVVR